MLRRTLLILGAVTALATTAPAATILWGAGEDNGFSAQDGSELDIGNLVRLGVFTAGANQAETDAFLRQNAGNVAALNQNFVQLGAARIGDAFGTKSNFQKLSTSDTSAVTGRQLYMWAFLSSDRSTDANAITSATQIGIYYLPLTVSSAWAVPPQNPVPGSTTIDISNLTNPAGTALVSGAQVVVGSFPRGTSSASQAPNFGLAAVPEPSSLMLLCSAGLLICRRSKRVI